ncbi:MAG: glycoside hydrolase family 2 protein, partial [Candidatus Limousia pullorum]
PVNFQQRGMSLFDRPETELSIHLKDSTHIEVVNSGKYPAISVIVEALSADREFYISDNCFWLEPGEHNVLKVNKTDGLTVKSFNYNFFKGEI